MAEYRLDPGSFDVLIQLLQPCLTVSEEMSRRAMSQCKTKPITVSSRVGVGLIMLAGGRVVECMRTHGLAKATVLATIVKIVHACCRLHNFAIKRSIPLSSNPVHITANVDNDGVLINNFWRINDRVREIEDR